MLKIFRTDIFTQAIIILIVAVLMWFHVFVSPQPVPLTGGGQLFYWLTGILSPRLATIIAFILVLVEGFLFNSMLYQNKMIAQNTLMPMLFYVIAMSIGNPTLTPLLVGNFLLMIAISQLMLTSTLLSLTLDKIFGAAAFIALATLVCPAMAVFFIPLIFNMFNYSLYSWRDWTMMILGALAPYFILETYFFVTDQLFYRNYLLFYGFTDFRIQAGGSTIEWVVGIVFLTILLIGLLAAIGNSQARTINFKKNITAILIFTIGSLAYTAYTDLIPVPTQAFAFPFACCTTSIFIEPKRKEATSNIFFLAIIAVFIILNFV